jgi:hypothetical protein
MSEFARRTGLSPAAQNQRRYLWADAFAVCNFLELFERTGDQQYSFSATPAGTSEPAVRDYLPDTPGQARSSAKFQLKVGEEIA